MKLTISKEANINYLAKIVSIKKGDFSSHPNANKLKLANVQGNINCMIIKLCLQKKCLKLSCLK